ncbi:MAG: permease-like cell division protein FtsX [Bacteroidales bacterium]|nr:permease-like cell division protein FtsX [Bacteroidales bacterium]MBP5316488.1 permease-like cell division protein FtsX [Bacteroidales bacterium]
MASREKNIIAKRLVQSYLSSVISISLVLLLIAIASFLVINATKVSDYFKENAVISVIMHQNATEADALALQEKLDGMDFVLQTKYISKEEGTRQMQELLGEDFLRVFEVNPIPFSVDVNVQSEYFSKDSLQKVSAMLQQLPKVREVTYQESLIESLNENLRKIAIVMGVAILLLMIISFALICTTVRLNIYAKRFTIHTMMLVGANRGFIRKPFVWQAFWQGAASAAIACALFTGILVYAKGKIGPMVQSIYEGTVPIVFAIVFIVGIALCIAAAWYVVGRLAYTTKDDLYY